MNAIGAYIITRNREAGRNPESGYPDNDPLEGAPEHGPGIGARVRKLFRPRVAREPGFARTARERGSAASSDWLDDFIPKLASYPYPNAIR